MCLWIILIVVSKNYALFVLYCHVLVPNSAYMNKTVFTQENQLFLLLATACIAKLLTHTHGEVPD